MKNVVTRLVSIEDIVNGNFFKVPDYQRGYSWEENQLADLIKDINHIAHIDYKHYTGTIVITKNPGSHKFEIVDGQQRLTTIIILLKSIYDFDPVKYSSIRDIFLIRNDSEYVLETNDETNFYFKEAIIGDKKSLPDDIKSLSNLKFAKEYFGNWIKENPLRVNEIYQTVVSKLGFICFSPVNTNEIGIMFEVINNRGKALSELEKIKNYFIYYSTINSKNSLRNKINENWGIILKYLSKAGVTSNDEENSYLRNCFIVFYSSNKSKSWNVYNELKEKYRPEDKLNVSKNILEIEQFIDFIQQAALSYAYFFNGNFFNNHYNSFSKGELNNELKRLRCHPVNASILPLYIAAMTYLFDRPCDVIEILKLIEILNFRVYVIPNTKIARADSRQGELFYLAHEFNRDRDWESEPEVEECRTCLNRLIEGDIFDFVKMHLEDLTSCLCPEEVFIQSLTIDNDESIDYYNWNGLRFFLASYEEYLNGARKESWDIEKILITRTETKNDRGNDYLSREHIWARGNRNIDFPADSKEKRRLGNFVLLGLSSNIQLQDDDIETKVKTMIENSSISLLQVQNLKEYVIKSIAVAGSRRERRTKYFYQDIATSLNDQRENDLIFFALKRWKLPDENFHKFHMIDSFQADQNGSNEYYFIRNSQQVLN